MSRQDFIAAALAVILTISATASADLNADDRGFAPAAEPPAVQQADETVSDAGLSEIELVQFRGFRSPAFGRLPFAAATPRMPVTSPSSANTTAAAGPPQRILTRAPMTPRRRRLAQAPDMLGDSFLPSMQLTLQPLNLVNGLAVNTPLAVAGGAARSKIGEHNKALPVDRFYANYNHFHNALDRQIVSPGLGQGLFQSASVDRFTLGAERTLFEGDASVELRLPLTNYPDLDGGVAVLGPAGRFRSDSGTAGNLSLIGKQLLVNSEDLIVSCGLGIEFPTGADAAALSGTTLFNVKNESLFLQPFLAITLDNGEAFVHSFLQVDIDLTGQPLEISDLMIPAPPVGVGEITQQTLLHWDTSAGIWLARSEAETGLTGVAAIVEFHLTSTTSSSDPLTGNVPTIGGPVDFLLSSAANDFTAAYITTGLHTEFGRHQTLRVAGVFPLRTGDNRFFDAEVLVQIGRRY
ncbi:MAG: hypothetical protein RIK87_22070 [Fuerstiella sp.]